METIKTAVIDDEASARDTLKGILEKFFTEITVMGEAGTIQDGIALVEQNPIDLLFLDIKMQYGTGFDILKKAESVNFGLIFVTAYDQYAIDAFKFSAIDYLLKPIKISDLREAIKRYKNNRKHSQDYVHVLMDNLENTGKKLFRLVLPTVDGFQVVDIKDIIRLEGMRNYTRFILVDDTKVVVPYTMKKYEELLAEYGFMRIHLSHIINLRHVKKYTKGQGGEVEMTDGSFLGISRSKKKLFLSKFM